MRALLLIAWAFSLVAMPAHAQQDAGSNFITVSGEATVSVRPDRAALSVGVTSAGKTAQEASESNARDMTAVLAALKDAGIAESDVQTSRLSLQPQYDPNRAGKQRVVGFQANNQVTATVRDIGKLATLIDRAIGAGANDIGGIQFSVTDPSKALDEARKGAIADAKRKAEIFAQAAGVQIGRPMMIIEDGAPAPGPMAMRAVAATPIAVGEETLRASVSVSFQLMH
jgi:uncharacterized protein YggE